MTDAGSWNIDDALGVLQARMDPAIWDQGQELYRRGAVRDFAVSADGTIRIIVLDPRDSRNFFVGITAATDGRVTARCPCPYRLNGVCRHQVVALEYLRAIQEGQDPAEIGAAEPEPQAEEKEPEGSGPVGTVNFGTVRASGPALYRLAGAGSPVPTAADGSVLRLALLSVGGLETPHRVVLHLRGKDGWSEVRTPDVARWITRGDLGPHPRDAALVAVVSGGGSLRGEIDSETLAYLLPAFAGGDALVDRSGRPLAVEREPWTLGAELEKDETTRGVNARLFCRPASGGASRPFDEVVLIPSVAPWIQLEEGTFHPLDAGATGPLLEQIQDEVVGAAEDEALDRFLVEGVAHLEQLTRGRLEVPFGLIEDVEGVDGARLVLAGGPGELSGRLELSYGGEWVDAPETPAPWTRRDGGQILRYPAAGQSLARARRELVGAGFESSAGLWRLDGDEALTRALGFRGSFVEVRAPAELSELDLVHRAPTLRLKVVGADDDGDPGESSNLRVAFELLDGERRLEVEPGALLHAFERSRSSGVLRLADDSVLGLDHSCVRDLVEVLRSARAAGDELSSGGPLRIAATSVGLLLEESEGVETSFEGELASLAERLRSGGGAGAGDPLEEDIRALLRSYQRDAVGWFGDLASWGLAGILADEMGLGKTVMALAHLFGRRASQAASSAGPVLVVCPTSLAFNWIDECRRFFPKVRAATLQGRPRAERESELAAGSVDLIVTSYALLRRDAEALEARTFRAVVLDEAQHIKNPASQTAQAAFRLRSPQRWALTGTPIENHLGELWSVFRFLLPGFLGTEAEFKREIREPAERGEAEPLEVLRRRLRPFILRRMKEEVLSDLPPRIEQVERVPMAEFQRQLYEAHLLEARAAADSADGARGRMQVLAALTRLRQVCCHPRLVANEDVLEQMDVDVAQATSGKFELLFELLEECIEEGHRVLLFSQFTSVLDLIEEELDRREIVRCRLDGSTRDREGVVRRFERDTSVPLFLISLKAGGHGLNLTGADTVILYDPWWNPAVEEQAVARAHRLGQELPVHVHRLIAAETVEERILDLQAAKRDLAAKVLEAGEDAVSALDIDDLRALLS